MARVIDWKLIPIYMSGQFLGTSLGVLNTLPVGIGLSGTIGHPINPTQDFSFDAPYFTNSKQRK